VQSCVCSNNMQHVAAGPVYTAGDSAAQNSRQKALGQPSEQSTAAAGGGLLLALCTLPVALQQQTSTAAIVQNHRCECIVVFAATECSTVPHGAAGPVYTAAAGSAGQEQRQSKQRYNITKLQLQASKEAAGRGLLLDLCTRPAALHKRSSGSQEAEPSSSKSRGSTRSRQIG
jgi:hypothetical protein